MNVLTPLTKEEVTNQQKLSKRLYQKISFKKGLYRFITLLSVLTFIVSVFGVVLTHNPTILSISMGIFLSSFVISIMTFSLCVSSNHESEYQYFSQYQFLSKENHQEMLNLLNTLPDTGQAFHKNVAAQGREFVLKELQMLREWQKSHH